MKMTAKHPHWCMMSKAQFAISFFMLSAGLQDAYSYCVRGKVFANVQIGNIVLMSQYLFAADWNDTMCYLIPLLAFAGGLFAAELVRSQCPRFKAAHYRKFIALGVIAMLLVTGLLPNAVNILANSLVSFACAMQLQAFSTASIVCNDNLCSGAEFFSAFLWNGKRASIKKAGEYFGFIFLFTAGTVLGGVLAYRFRIHTIWFSCGLLLVSFSLMFSQDNIEDSTTIRSAEIRYDAADSQHDKATESDAIPRNE